MHASHQLRCWASPDATCCLTSSLVGPRPIAATLGRWTPSHHHRCLHPQSRFNRMICSFVSGDYAKEQLRPLPALAIRLTPCESAEGLSTVVPHALNTDLACFVWILVYARSHFERIVASSFKKCNSSWCEFCLCSWEFVDVSFPALAKPHHARTQSFPARASHHGRKWFHLQQFCSYIHSPAFPWCIQRKCPVSQSFNQRQVQRARNSRLRRRFNHCCLFSLFRRACSLFSFSSFGMDSTGARLILSIRPTPCAQVAFLTTVPTINLLAWILILILMLTFLAVLSCHHLSLPYLFLPPLPKLSTSIGSEVFFAATVFNANWHRRASVVHGSAAVMMSSSRPAVVVPIDLLISYRRSSSSHFSSPAGSSCRLHRSGTKSRRRRALRFPPQRIPTTDQLCQRLQTSWCCSKNDIEAFTLPFPAK